MDTHLIRKQYTHDQLKCPAQTKLHLKLQILFSLPIWISFSVSRLYRKLENRISRQLFAEKLSFDEIKVNFLARESTTKTKIRFRHKLFFQPVLNQVGRNHRLKTFAGKKGFLGFSVFLKRGGRNGTEIRNTETETGKELAACQRRKSCNYTGRITANLI